VSASLAVDIMHRAMILCLVVAAPLLITALIVGILVSMVQAVTQIQEQTLAFIPKLIAVALVMMIALPWMLSRLVEYLTGVLRLLPAVVG
jgi:flagellar biosynthetic protein FliQ